MASCLVPAPAWDGRKTADSPAIVMESQLPGGAGVCLPEGRWHGGVLAGSAHFTTHCAPGIKLAATAIARKMTTALIVLTQLYSTCFFVLQHAAMVDTL
jgi:hypothetical protein